MMMILLAVGESVCNIGTMGWRRCKQASKIGWRCVRNLMDARGLGGGERKRDRAVVELDAVDVKRINSIRADLDLVIVDGRAGIMNWDAVR